MLSKPTDNEKNEEKPMRSITESIDGGVQAVGVWQAFPRLVTDTGDITIRSHEWIESGMQGTYDSSDYDKRRNYNKCGKRKEHPNVDKEGWKGEKEEVGPECPYEQFQQIDWTTDFSATARAEPLCGASNNGKSGRKTAAIDPYSSCAETIVVPDNEEVQGVSFSANFDSEVVDGFFEECTSEGACTYNEITPNDDYEIMAAAGTTFNFVLNNSKSAEQNVAVTYELLQLNAKSGATALIASSLALLTVALF